MTGLNFNVRGYFINDYTITFHVYTFIIIIIGYQCGYSKYSILKKFIAVLNTSWWQ